MLDLFGRSGDRDAEFILVDVRDVAVEKFHELNDRHTGELGRLDLDDCQFQFQIIFRIKIRDGNHVDELVQLFFDLFEHIVVASCDDRHA